MKRSISIALLLVACDEPTRLPVDVGPRDVGPKDASSDSGTDAGDAGDGGDTGTGDTGVMPSGICEDRPCLTRVSNDAEWQFVSGPARSASRCDLVEETLFVLPKEAGTALTDTLYVDAEQYENLYAFFREHLAAELAGLDAAVYYDTFERTDRRTYWIGRIFRTSDNAYAFDLVADFYFGSPPSEGEIEDVRVKLMQTFGLTLAYAPQDTSAISRAEAFPNPPFGVLLPEPCAGEGCADPNAYCIVIPEGTELCGHFAEGRDIPGELAAKIRLSTIAGSYEIPRQVGSTPMRWFSGGELGAGRAPLDASASGTMSVQNIGGSLYYRYTQRVTAGADYVDLTWELYGGRNPEIFREPFLTQTNIYGVINDSQIFPDGQIVAGSCTASGLSRFFGEGTFNGGDSFRFTYRHQIPFAGSGPLFVTEGEATIGG